MGMEHVQINLLIRFLILSDLEKHLLHHGVSTKKATSILDTKVIFLRVLDKRGTQHSSAINGR